MLRQSLLQTFRGVAVGKTATSDLKLGQKIHVLWLKMGDDGTASNGNAADVDATLVKLCKQVRIMLNNKTQRICSAVELNALNSIYGAAYSVKTSGVAGTAGYRVYLPIFLAEIYRKTNAEVGRLAWNLVGVKDPQIEIDLGDGCNAPIVEGYYEWEPADTSAGIGGICKWVRQNVAVVGQELDIPLARKNFIQSVHFFPTAEASPKYVNKLKVTAGNDDVRAPLTTLDNQAMLLAREFQPDVSSTPRFDYVIDYDDPINQALAADNLASLNAAVEMNGAANGNMTVITQRVGAPD